MAPKSTSDADRLRAWLGSPAWLESLLRDQPTAAEGLARLTDAATRGGALAASIKWLCMGAVAAAKLQPDLIPPCLRNGFEAGLTREEADGAALTLLASRGIPPYRLFVTSVDTLVPRSDSRGAEVPDGPIDPEDIKAYAASVHGEVPARVQLMADELPRALEGYLLLRRAGLRQTGLSAMHTELLLVAINSSLYEADFVATHADAARREGATDTELAEAVATSIPFGGLAAWRPGAAGIAASRPDETLPGEG